MLIGNYRCQVNDTVEISADKSTIIINGKNSETTHIDINDVIEGESPYEFLLKCLANPKTCLHMYRHTTKEMTEEEKKMLLRSARLNGQYDLAKELEQNGVILESRDDYLALTTDAITTDEAGALTQTSPGYSTDLNLNTFLKKMEKERQEFQSERQELQSERQEFQSERQEFQSDKKEMMKKLEEVMEKLDGKERETGPIAGVFKLLKKKTRPSSFSGTRPKDVPGSRKKWTGSNDQVSMDRRRDAIGQTSSES